MGEKFEKYRKITKKQPFLTGKRLLKNISKKIKKVLDFFDLRVIILVFCLSRRYSSIGRATDL